MTSYVGFVQSSVVEFVAIRQTILSQWAKEIAFQHTVSASFDITFVGMIDALAFLSISHLNLGVIWLYYSSNPDPILPLSVTPSHQHHDTLREMV